MEVSFTDRLALIMRLTEVQGGTLPSDARQLAEAVSRAVARHVEVETAQMWIDGRAMPSDYERGAIAACLGFEGEDAAYLASDDPSAYMPYYDTVSTYVELQSNRSGLVALRPLTDAPLSQEAMKDLGRLG